jgi:hypothetical protein
LPLSSAMAETLPSTALWERLRQERGDYTCTSLDHYAIRAQDHPCSGYHYWNHLSPQQPRLLAPHHTTKLSLQPFQVEIQQHLRLSRPWQLQVFNSVQIHAKRPPDNTKCNLFCIMQSAIRVLVETRKWKDDVVYMSAASRTEAVFPLVCRKKLWFSRVQAQQSVVPKCSPIIILGLLHSLSSAFFLFRFIPSPKTFHKELPCLVQDGLSRQTAVSLTLSPQMRLTVTRTPSGIHNGHPAMRPCLTGFAWIWVRPVL